MICDVVFGFSYFDSGFSSTKAVIMRLHWSPKAAKPLCAPLVNTVSDRLRFWELGCEHLYVLTVLLFSVFDRIFVVVVVFCGFADDTFFEVSNRPSHGFLFCKLKISLSKITDLPFRSVRCLKNWVGLVHLFLLKLYVDSFNF